MDTEVFMLADHDLQRIESMIEELRSIGDMQSQGAIDHARLLAHELPRSLRSFLDEFAVRGSTRGACIIRGFQPDESIGSTPPYPRKSGMREKTFREEAYLTILAELIGKTFGWVSQFEGQFTQDILPVRENETAQVSSSSKVDLALHVEEAFHPFRPDFIALLCLRNPDCTPTTWTPLDRLCLGQEDLDLLFEPRFPVIPDDSYFRGDAWSIGPKASQTKEASVFEKIRLLRETAVDTAIMFGAREEPYICLDVPFTLADKLQPPYDGAWRRLLEALDRETIDTVLEPGDVIFLDNFRTAHGRRPYTPRYDGLDRWLMRIQIAVDLRKSRAVRESAQSRVLL
jgi:Fe(II)/alpha-ketoglutarate-dependent arginine beta-hydroxylase